MPLPVYERFTDEQIKQFGPVKKHFDSFTTERHVYVTPFMYDNLDVGDFYEIDPTKGIEMKADTGYITITETKPILAVDVVGSACVPNGYNICEWWDDEESIDNMKDQLVKRQRIDNLNGTHPSIYSQLMLGAFPGLTMKNVTDGQMRDAADCLRKLTHGFYCGYYMGFYENTAHFRVGPPYPTKVTIRSGCNWPEDEGTENERPKGEYAVRVIETTVIASGL